MGFSFLSVPAGVVRLSVFLFLPCLSVFLRVLLGVLWIGAGIGIIQIGVTVGFLLYFSFFYPTYLELSVSVFSRLFA